MKVLSVFRKLAKQVCTLAELVDTAVDMVSFWVRPMGKVVLDE